MGRARSRVAGSDRTIRTLRWIRFAASPVNCSDCGETPESDLMLGRAHLRLAAKRLAPTLDVPWRRRIEPHPPPYIRVANEHQGPALQPAFLGMPCSRSPCHRDGTHNAKLVRNWRVRAREFVFWGLRKTRSMGKIIGFADLPDLILKSEMFPTCFKERRNL